MNSVASGVSDFQKCQQIYEEVSKISPLGTSTFGRGITLFFSDFLFIWNNVTLKIGYHPNTIPC